ncbi:hypothetical protein G7K_4783-t1 [Saitoella complicata NRRL Y-17804]|uniref:tRNA N(3)-methylcytidine methyltransferase n=1 Tax=Saitoella complicata (strain BCRC 22490 / CBS 7301 / JCM 7358 / NBRC 10748 / NRRL Y-17804) TaxID=698492 RepID=A0A0E9NLV1_SAICN|nr:hypothetical protein G7K_4783-t1 [Saitoella complicata NRRL Y-17804]
MDTSLNLPAAATVEETLTSPSIEDPFKKKKVTSSVVDVQNPTNTPTFGSRLLTDEEKVFEHNAWDHVEWGPEQEATALESIERQLQDPVPEQDKERYNGDPASFWDAFYSQHNENFFKDRAWLAQEFPELAACTLPEAGPKVVVEVGCGAGNTMFPVLNNNKNPDLKVIGCDFSKEAVRVVRESPYFDPKHAGAEVWDLAEPSGALPVGVEPGSVNIIVLVFVLSALAPSQWEHARRNIRTMLKPGGLVLFRDYGRYDMTQLRFKKNRLLDSNFYIRGDGTRVYFFTNDEVEGILGGEGMVVEQNARSLSRLGYMLDHCLRSHTSMLSHR